MHKYTPRKTNHNKLALIFKKILFAFLRSRLEASLYENRPKNKGDILRILHIGDAFRGRNFIDRLYGYLPERKVLGKRFVLPYSGRLESLGKGCDLILVEINRLYANKYREAGYFIIPQWVEFTRDVVKNPNVRYKGAKKSLKSDLNRIRNSDLNVVITKDHQDFNLFYEKMYLPYLSERFGDSMIAKSRKKLKKDFLSGFLILIDRNGRPIAGAIIRIDNNTVTQTNLAVLDGEKEIIRTGVSGFIDYHLHEWAAINDKSHINVGHTNPFLLDGVFFNKRKWIMSVIPDHDGVMDMAVKICRDDAKIVKILKNYPFVFQNKSGLGVLCTYSGPEKAGIEEVRKLRRRFWTKGLKDMVIVSDAGYQNKTIEKAKELFGVGLHLLSNFSQAVELQKENA